MTLKEIGEGIRKSITENKPLMMDKECAIRKVEGHLYFELDFLKKYGNIIRQILRDMLWEEVNNNGRKE